MDTIIKWPGGKTRELNIISDYIPDFERFFEPFFGGGAVGLNLEPIEAYVNDIDQLLIQFYRDVKNVNSNFYPNFTSIINDWRILEKIVDPLMSEFERLFPDSIGDMKSLDIGPTKSAFSNLIQPEFSKISALLEYTQPEETLEYLIKTIESKISRIIKLQIKHEKIFDDNLLRDHLMTGVKSGYYTLIRNEYFNKNPNSAVFYFIREFCYGSMFRFNSKGEFNIPYGGINYNLKDIENKFEYLQSPPVQETLGKFSFYNTDFDKFFNNFDLCNHDFIFLDPPYDSDFKNYGKNPFTSKDQERLAEFLETCPAKWLLVIQKSELIWDLYETMNQNNENINIMAYDKKYTYNVRGRNERDVSHLLIKNY